MARAGALAVGTSIGSAIIGGGTQITFLTETEVLRGRVGTLVLVTQTTLAFVIFIARIALLEPIALGGSLLGTNPFQALETAAAIRVVDTHTTFLDGALLAFF